MYKSVFTIAVLVLINSIVHSQTIPADSMFLGQTAPGATPEKFKLAVTKGSFAAERIAISIDGKEIYFSEVKSYYPATGDTIKFYRYADNKWTGPFNLFAGYISPTLTTTGDTLFFETAKTNYETYYSVKKGNHWSAPQRMLKNLNSAHYLQVTGLGNYFISSVAEDGVGESDWCKLLISGADSMVHSLGKPLNTDKDNLDFFMARDESFIIIATGSGLAISYKKSDGEWTGPENMGKEINYGLGSWGPYVTADCKYLFYSTGTKPDYSDTGIYWVKFDKFKTFEP